MSPDNGIFQVENLVKQFIRVASPPYIINTDSQHYELPHERIYLKTTYILPQKVHI